MQPDVLYLIVTAEQLKQGWIELRGVTPIHHNYVVLAQTENGNYVVKAPVLPSQS